MDQSQILFDEDVNETILQDLSTIENSDGEKIDKLILLNTNLMNEMKKYGSAILVC